jgi:hypothetical protein
MKEEGLDYYKVCPDCMGDDTRLSDCCGAEPFCNGDNDSLDFGICPECGEHCEFLPCETCKGTGYVSKTEEDLLNERINEIISNYEIKHDN